jgi:hypothetical protein
MSLVLGRKVVSVGATLLLGDDEVTLKGIHSGLLLLPHEVSGVLALTGDSDEGGMCHHHVPGGSSAAQADHAHTGQTDCGQGGWGARW